MTQYNYCESRRGFPRIAQAVCEKFLAEGRCSKDKKGKCKEVRTMNLSEEERAKRSERMKNLRKGNKKEEVDMNDS